MAQELNAINAVFKKDKIAVLKEDIAAIREARRIPNLIIIGFTICLGILIISIIVYGAFFSTKPDTMIGPGSIVFALLAIFFSQLNGVIRCELELGTLQSKYVFGGDEKLMSALENVKCAQISQLLQGANNEGR